MRPRTYDSYADQKRDQRIGFIVFPIVNVIVWAVTSFLWSQTTGLSLQEAARVAQLRTTANLLPWIVNGLILIWALIFRRHIAVGYLVSAAGFAIVGLGLGLISVVAYFVSAPVQALFDLIGFVFFLLLILVVGGWFLFKMFGVLKRWWAV